VESAVDQVDATRHADDLRGLWQTRALARAPRDMFPVVLSVIAHNYDEALEVLLELAGKKVTVPFLCTAGHIAKDGRVYARVVTPTVDLYGQRTMEYWELFKNLREMEGKFRRLADELKLTDKERVEMFKAVQRWIVCDHRIDPAMNPRDPDAKRLTH
jgi:hypothetical protein